MTAVNAPPSASVRASTPATRRATSSASPAVTRLMTKPTVPAVAGSRRRNSAGPRLRPTSRAIAQPRIISTTTVATVIGVSSAGSSSLAALPCEPAAPRMLTRWSYTDTTPTNSGTSSSASRRARLTTRGMTWRSRPTSRQAWLRVSNSFGGVRGAGTYPNDGVRGRGSASVGAFVPRGTGGFWRGGRVRALPSAP